MIPAHMLLARQKCGSPLYVYCEVWSLVLLVSGAAFSSPAFAQSTSALRSRLEGSVVFIQSVKTRKDGTGTPEVSTGTGFVITEDGYVITASHVVLREDIHTVVETKGAVQSRHNNAFKLEPVKRDDDIDAILLLFPDVGQQWKPVRRGNSRSVPKDAQLYTLGFPGNLDLSPASGVLSNKFGPKGTWQTTLAYNRGHSGGPIVDISGDLVAVATAGNDAMQGVTFAIPESYLRGLMQLAQVAKARDPNWDVAWFASGQTRPSFSKVFSFYKGVSPEGQDAAQEIYCLPDTYSIQKFRPAITTQSGAETRLISVSQDPTKKNCVTINAFIKGGGVTKYGPIVVDYQERGWLGIDVLLEATSIEKFQPR